MFTVTGKIKSAKDGKKRFAEFWFFAQPIFEYEVPLDRQIEEFFVAAIFFVTKKRASLKCEIVNGAARVEASEKDLIPAIIYHLRVWNNLTMQALAEKAGLKSHAQIARYESGASCPSFSQFQKILGALGKNIDVNIDEHTRVA